MDKRISVIIPVFNTACYLQECIDSLIKQTYKNLEIILVDDGSTDNSLSICRGYASNDSRIIVIQKENGGQASARNLGLDYATGDYITFLDSDDSLSLDTFLVNMDVLNKNSDIDCLQYPIYMNYGSNKSYIRRYSAQLHNKDLNIYKTWLNDNIVSWIVCNKIIKSSIIKDLRFNESMIYEDNYFVIDLIKRINNIYISDKGMYYYFKRENSTTTSTHSKQKDLDTIKVLSYLLDDLIFFKLEKLFLNYLVRIINIERSLQFNFNFKSSTSNKYLKQISLLSIFKFEMSFKDRLKLFKAKIFS